MNNIEIKSRNHFIDILKGICIIFVVITHFDFKGNELRMFLSLLDRYGCSYFYDCFRICLRMFFYKEKYREFIKAYKLKNIVNKIIRYSIPFLIAFIVGEFGYRIIGGWRHSSLFYYTIAFLRGKCSQEDTIIQ